NRSYTERSCPSSFLHPKPSGPCLLRSSPRPQTLASEEDPTPNLRAITAQDTAVSKFEPPRTTPHSCLREPPSLLTHRPTSRSTFIGDKPLLL
ncbi:unnamed protein product, partial [Brassica oleracea]